MRTKQNWNKYFIEGLLIVFSVLFALIINSTFEKYQTHKKKNIALNGILKEIKTNQEILKNWRSRHQEIFKHLDNLDNQNIEAIDKQKSINISYFIGNGSVVKEFLGNSAWETAKSSGIISEFDFNLSQALAKTYNQQDFIENKTLVKIFDLLTNIDSYQEQNLAKTKIQLQLLFNELLGQEISLNTYYQEVISLLSKNENTP